MAEASWTVPPHIRLELGRRCLLGDHAEVGVGIGLHRSVRLRCASSSCADGVGLDDVRVYDGVPRQDLGHARRSPPWGNPAL